jgi:spore maturation protein CgeB
MKLVIFGLTISSSWGNGHATLWRGLCGALLRMGWHVVFFERDVPYYAAHRDLSELPAGGVLRLYASWPEIAEAAQGELADADIGMVTSYCPDGIAASELVLASKAQLRFFYDLDTPVTLARLAAGEAVDYIGARGLGDFDLVLSFTGGEALTALKTRLGARRTAPLYGSVDPDMHRPRPPVQHYVADLSYLGTYAADRQAKLEELLVMPARRLPDRRFVIGGAQYPNDFPWTSNIHFVRHLPPAEHPAFFSSSRFTLNVTRASMAAMGFCPSGRMFEAAACGAPMISDYWAGLEALFEPGSEIVLAHNSEDITAALDMSEEQRQGIARRARERVLAEHTAAHRARKLAALAEEAARGAMPSLQEG